MNAAVFLFAAVISGADPVAQPAPAAPAVVTSGSACAGDCGKSTFVGHCGSCDPCAKVCLLTKLKDKLCKPCHTCAVEKPVVVVKVKPVCKVEPVCDPCATKHCWHPGDLLHKIKAKLCTPCSHKIDHAPKCQGGCGTAASPVGCGSTVIPPKEVPAAAPKTGPAPTPEPKKIPAKVGSLQGINPVQSPIVITTTTETVNQSR